MNWSSGEMSQLSTEDDSFDLRNKKKGVQLHPLTMLHPLTEILYCTYITLSKPSGLYNPDTVNTELKTNSINGLNNNKCTWNILLAFLYREYIKSQTYLEYAWSIGCPPCIQKVIFACAHKPFTCRTKDTHTHTHNGRWAEEMQHDRGMASLLHTGRKRKGLLLCELQSFQANPTYSKEYLK